jgi:hypothetical protein
MVLIKAKCLFSFFCGAVLWCASYTPCNAQTEPQGKDLAPCNIEVSLEIRNNSTDYDLLAAAIKKAKVHCNDSIQCILYDRFSYTVLVVHVKNTADTMNTISGYFEDWGILKMDFYRVEKGKHIPIGFYNPNIDLMDIEIPPKKVHSGYILTLSNIEFSKIETGLHVMRASYRQKCGNTIETKYTNYAYFRVIK